MLSKAIFIHSHSNLAYKSPFIIRYLRSRTITPAALAKDAVRVRSVTQLEQDATERTLRRRGCGTN